MKNKHKKSVQKVISYFNTGESRWGYSLLLKGTKHFGYYPKGKERIFMKNAQSLMELELGKRLNKPKNSLILDAGSGEGNVAIYLAQKFGFRIEGVDLLDFAVKIANKKVKSLGLRNQVHFQTGDYTYLKFPDKTFDGVYTMETLVHVPDYKKALKEFYRVLKPDGKLVLFEYSVLPPEYLSEEERYYWDIIVEETAMHSLPHFLHDKFPEILREAGFKNVSVENITPRIFPMLKIFYRLAYIPYIFIKALRVERKFVNATFSVEAYPTIKKDYWRYNIVTATKA